MKNLPDIDPEVLGLLEEIVADPRSAMRLVPGKALRSWFDTGEAARASEIATTRAERHLIEEHRESLAALLCEAAWIAYWKAPVLVHRPVDTDGRLYHPTEREPDWAKKSWRFHQTHQDSEVNATLLRECLSGLRADHAHELATASLALVPCDRTRFYAALTLPWSSPRSAIRLLGDLASRPRAGQVRGGSLQTLGSRLCAVHRIGDARTAYQQESWLDEASPYGHICSMVLSCLLGDLSTAVNEAKALERVASLEDARVADVRIAMLEWKNSLDASTLDRLQRHRAVVLSDMPELGSFILEVFKP